MYLESSGICFDHALRLFYKCGLNDHAGVTKMTTQLQVYLRQIQGLPNFWSISKFYRIFFGS